jgi:hypothetical protein
MVVFTNNTGACLWENVPRHHERDPWAVVLADAEIHQLLARCLVPKFGIGSTFKQVRETSCVTVSLAGDRATAVRHLGIELIYELFATFGGDEHDGRVNK